MPKTPSTCRRNHQDTSPINCVNRISSLTPNGALLCKHTPAKIQAITNPKKMILSKQNQSDPFFIPECDLLRGPDNSPRPIIKLLFKRINFGPFYIIWTSDFRNEGSYIMQLNSLVNEDTPEAEGFRSITGFRSPLVNRRNSFDKNTTLKQKRGCPWGWKAIVCWNHSMKHHNHFILETLYHISKFLNYRAHPEKQCNYAYHLTASDVTDVSCDASLDKLITDYDVRKVIHYYYFYPFLVEKFWDSTKAQCVLPKEITTCWYKENQPHVSFFFSLHDQMTHSSIAIDFGYQPPIKPSASQNRTLTASKVFV